MLTYILACTFYSLLSRSIGQNVAYDKEVPLVNALVLRNLSEYRHKSSIAN